MAQSRSHRGPTWHTIMGYGIVSPKRYAKNLCNMTGILKKEVDICDMEERHENGKTGLGSCILQIKNLRGHITATRHQKRDKEQPWEGPATSTSILGLLAS